MVVVVPALRGSARLGVPAWFFRWGVYTGSCDSPPRFAV
jgi:hypothetical protein